MAGSEWTEVFVTADPVEAEIVKGLLESSGFPVLVHQRGLKGLAFYLGNLAPGELVLLVPPDQADAACDLLESLPSETGGSAEPGER